MLARARRSRCVTQEQVARALGVTQQAVSRMEHGEASLSQLVRVCKILGVELRIALASEGTTLVHALHPEERREIEANIEWFSRLTPARRLRVMEAHVRTMTRLRDAAGVAPSGR